MKAIAIVTLSLVTVYVIFSLIYSWWALRDAGNERVRGRLLGGQIVLFAVCYLLIGAMVLFVHFADENRTGAAIVLAWSLVVVLGLTAWFSFKVFLPNQREASRRIRARRDGRRDLTH